MPRLLILLGLYVLLTLVVAIALWEWSQLRSLLNSLNSISNKSDFEQFKRVVKSNMLLALVAMVLCAFAVILGALGLLLGMLGWIDVSLLIVIFGPVCSFAGFKLTSVESRVKAITVSDELRSEFEFVVAKWQSSAFPNW
jgi:hypothetical protein